MRIVSLNCWSGRVSGLVPYLAGLDADVYCLQEVMDSPAETPDVLIYEEQGSIPQPQRSKLFRELCEALPEYQGFHLPAACGYLHDGARTPHKAFYGIATFVRRGVPVIGSQSGFVHGGYRPDNWGDPPLPRSAHAVRVWDYASDQAVVVAHMHGMWLKNGKSDTPDRIVQGSRLADLARKVGSPDDRYVVCGDFNVLPDSDLFFAFRGVNLQGLAPIELVTSRGHKDTRTGYYKKTPRYADYMLVSRNIRVESFQVPPRPEVSDHRPLILDISKYPATPP